MTRSMGHEDVLTALLKLTIASGLFLLVIAACPTPASSATIGHMLARECPNGAALASAMDAADEADAVNDANRYELNREAARQLYRCAHVVDDPYAHDWARAIYCEYFWSSFETDGDVLRNAQNLIDILAERAAGSEFYDVRKAAAELRGQYARIYQSLKG
jgi:hypothetical protein